LAWVRERLLIPADEWRQLLQRAAADGVPKAAWIDGLAEKALRLVPPDASNSGDYLVVAAEDAPFIARTLYPKKPHCRWLDLRDDRPRSIAGDIRRTDGGPALDGAALLAQWLRFYGPLDIDRMRKLLGMNRSLMDNLLTTLIDTRSLVSGHLVERESDVLFCDADNFETLLRMARRRKRETLVPRPVADLAPLLARQQGIIGTPDAAASLDDCLSRLACLVLPAALWETEILPARRRRYDPHELDRLLQTTALMWIGAPGRRLTFCHATDLDLIPPDSENSASTASHDGENLPGLAAIQRFPAQRGRYTVADLMGDPPESVQTVLAGLWEAAWAGRVTNDSMSTLRHALSRKGVRPVPSSVASGHGRFGSRRQRRRPVMETRGGAAGCWRIVPAPPPSEGRIAAEELSKERVRVLLDRYGILFRELLAREHPAFQWAAIFRTLRLMELAGEVVGGLFFDGLPGPQFASPPFINHLRQTRRDDAIFWICAQDPASLCGLGIAALAEDLPRRVAGTHLVYRGNRLVLVSMGWGHRVSIRTAPDDPHLFDCLTVFDHLLDRPVDPRRRITIDTINAIAAPQSPFLYLFRKRFDTLIETHRVTLYTRREV
jgi:ATP-dependent helicase Lhr and Lhr-like helicase